MDCKTAENEISRREAGLLDPAQQAELAAHLAGCHSCRDADKRVKESLRALSSLPITPAPRDFLEDSWRKISKVEAPRPTGKMQRLRNIFHTGSGPPAWLPVAIAALVVGLAVVLPSLRDGGGGSGPPAPCYTIDVKEGPVLVKELPRGAATFGTMGKGRLEVTHLKRAHYTFTSSASLLNLGLGRPAAAELETGEVEVRVDAEPKEPYELAAAGVRISGAGVRYRVQVGPDRQVEALEGSLKVIGPEWSRDVAAGGKLAWTDAGAK